jgi:hypothetical protein
VTFNISRFIGSFYFNVSFQVTAKGSPDVSLSWLYDLQLSVAKQIGQLLSTALNPCAGMV